ncbi:carbohydrate kinase family protein [Nonlabens agnitus]|uniref:Carbohydrate kinase n=1 Tax=Nonlabens agnitus TaxID=870484 RepID=A0A2S9WWU3_9FLAO|nr:carbohydrate kinase [Nonlabens agnitus]PRP67924.1 carbohydrate kinase [Nonlabens agnitus]
MKDNNKQVICIGEILIDFIGLHRSPDIAHTAEFKRFLGGSPANVAMNLTKLGFTATLVATIGDDGLGDFLLQEMQSLGMNQDHVRKVTDVPTSTILVSKTSETPDFIAYREADCEIINSQLPDDVIKSAAVFHTTCFALSRNPARDTILEKVKVAATAGCLISIDLNYSARIWPDKDQAIKTIKEYCSYGAMIKISMDDMQRLYGNAMTSSELFETLHGYGANLICLTRGSDGVIVSRKDHALLEMPAIPITSVEDATGAGDAFWSGFLCAMLENRSLEQCVEFALKVASIKLTTIGGLPANLSLQP